MHSSSNLPTNPLRNATSNAAATLPISQDYAKLGGGDIDPSLKASIYDAALVANISHSSSAIAAQCPTGNCTFSDFASLAICSQCRNVTFLFNETAQQRATQGNHCLPIGLCLDTSAANNLVLSSELPLNTNALNAYQPSLSYISLIFAEYHETPGDMGPPDFFGFECIFALCTQLYHSHVVNGVLTEAVSHTFYQRDMEIRLTDGSKGPLFIPNDPYRRPNSEGNEWYIFN